MMALWYSTQTLFVFCLSSFERSADVKFMASLPWTISCLVSVGICECVYVLCTNSYNQGNLTAALWLFKLPLAFPLWWWHSITGVLSLVLNNVANFIKNLLLLQYKYACVCTLSNTHTWKAINVHTFLLIWKLSSDMQIKSSCVSVCSAIVQPHISR